MKISAFTVIAATSLFIAAGTAHAADELRAAPPPPPPVIAPAYPAPPAAATVVKPTIVTPTVPKPIIIKPAPAVPAKVSAVPAPTAPKVEAKTEAKVATQPAPAIQAQADNATLRQLNKKYLLEFVRAATSGDVRPFYKANKQFASSMTEAQFVNKFGKYTELPNDITAIEAHDFADTTITKIDNNRRYKGCQLIEAKSNVKLQIVQDSHNYKLTNRYCLKDADYKLVSFKLGYEE